MILWLIFFTLISNGLNLAVPKIISNAIDGYTSNTLNLNYTIGLFFVVSVAIFLTTYIQNIIQIYTSERVARELRMRLIGKIAEQDYNYIQGATPSKLLTNLTSDVDSVKGFVAQSISSIISSAFLIVGASVLLLMINWKLALAVLAIVPIIGITFAFVFSKVRVLFKASQETIDWLNRVIDESILGSALIRLVNSQAFEYQKFIAANQKAKEIGLKILQLFAGLMPVIALCSNLAVLAILVLGGHFVITGSMTLGDFTAFNSYLTILIFPIIIIGFTSNVISQASASYGRLAEILDTPKKKNPGTLKKSLTGSIEVNNITLKFAEKYVLKDVSFAIKPGTRTAIM